jgi:hypothetical protein
MKKEHLILEAESVNARNFMISEFRECIEFAGGSMFYLFVLFRPSLTTFAVPRASIQHPQQGSSRSVLAPNTVDRHHRAEDETHDASVDEDESRTPAIQGQPPLLSRTPASVENGTSTTEHVLKPPSGLDRSGHVTRNVSNTSLSFEPQGSRGGLSASAKSPQLSASQTSLAVRLDKSAPLHGGHRSSPITTSSHTTTSIGHPFPSEDLLAHNRHPPSNDRGPFNLYRSDGLDTFPKFDSNTIPIAPQARPLLPSVRLTALPATPPVTAPSPPNSPVEELIIAGPITSTIAAQMKCKVFLQQQHAQWKSLGAARLKVYLQQPTNLKQLVVEADNRGGAILISTIILTDGVERVGKTGVAVELSDKGMRTGIIYMIQLRNELSAGGLFDSLIAGSDRASRT